MHDVPHTDPASGGDEGGRSPSRLRRGLKYAAYALGGLIGVVVLVVGGGLLILQTNWGSARVSRVLIDVANPTDAVQIDIGDVDGNWLMNLTLRDVTLFRIDTTGAAPPDTVRMVQIDSLRLRYALADLFDRKIHVREVSVFSPTIRARQQADSTWDLIAPFVSDAPPDTAQAAFSFQIDQIRLVDGRLTADFYSPRRDSTLRIRDLDVRAGDLFISADRTAFDLDRLTARFTPPAQELPRRLTASAALTGEQLAVHRLRLASPYSNVFAEGTLRLPEDTTDTLGDVDFELTADPLSFRDLAGFVPGVDTSRSLTLDAQVTGSGRRLRAALDAQFSDGGAVTLTAEGTPTTEGPLRYALDATVRGLDPGFFTAAEEAGRLSADVQVDLEGPSLEALSGTVRAALFDTRVAGYAPDRTRLTARFTDGRARLDLRTGLYGATFTAEGAARPFAETPSYDLRINFADLDLGRVLEDSTLQSDLAGTLQVEGEGLDPAAADLRAVLNLRPSRINRYRLEDGRLVATLEDGRLAFGVQVASAQQGGLALEGAVAGLGGAGGDLLRYRIGEGRLDGLDLAALIGDTTRSRLSGTFALDGRGADPEALRLDPLTLHLENSVYGAYEIAEADLRATLAGGRLHARLKAALEEAGAVALTATARPFADPLTYAVPEATFSHVDIGALLQNPQQQTDLSGTLSLAGRGADLEALRLTLDAALDSSQINRQRIEAAQLTAALSGGELEYDVQLALPEGGAVLSGAARPFAEAPQLTLREGRFEHLNLGALAGLPALETDLTGTLEAALRGADPETMQLEAALALAPSRINREPLEEGRLRVEADSGILRLDGLFDFAEGRAVLDGRARLGGERPSYRLTADLQNIDVDDLVGLDTLEAGLSLDAQIEGEGLDPETMTLRVRLRSDSAFVDEARLQRLALEARLADGLLRVDTLRLRTNLATATGGGRLALFDTARTSDFTVQADVNDLGPLRPLLNARLLALDGGAFTATVTGPSDRLQVDVAAELRSLVYNELRLAGLETQVSAVLDSSFAPVRAETRGTLAYFSLPSLGAENINYRAAYDGDTLQVASRLRVGEGQAARLDVTAHLQPDRQQVLLTQAQFELGEEDWQLLQEAGLSYGDEYRIEGLLLYSDEEQIAVDGVVDFDGEQNLIVTIENVQIDTAADLLDFEELSGTLGGSLVLTGPATAPNLRGRLNLGIAAEGEPTGDLRLTLRYDSLRLHTEALLTHRDGSTLAVEGSLPLDLRLQTPSDTTGLSAGALLDEQPVDFTLRADAFSIGWVQPFLDPATVDRLDGALTARVTLTGTPNDPVLSGGATLGEGAVGLPALGVTYTDLQAALDFDDNRVEVRTLSLESGDGTLTATGTIDLPDLTLGEYDLSLAADELLAISTRDLRAEVDADLELRGTTDLPELVGDIEVLSGDFYLGAGGEGGADVAEVSLSPEAIRTLEQRFGVRIAEADTSTIDTFEAMAMDLDLTMQRDVWLRSRANPELNVQFTGSLDLMKEHYEELQLFGVIEVLPERSYIDAYGRRFHITDGLLTFNGPPADPLLDVAAVYEVAARGSRGNEATINLGVEGRLDDLDFSLSATPAMETTDILSYIATGRPAGAALVGRGGAGSGLTTGGFAAGLAVGQVAGLIENLAADSEVIQLDVFEIQTDGLEGTRLTAGKYVEVSWLPRPLFVAVSQPVSFGSARTAGTNLTAESTPTEVTLEYALTTWLLVRLVRENYLRINLLWEYAY